MTALPPPNGSPAIASFRVIAPDGRMASSNASAGVWYTFIRVPPPRGRGGSNGGR